MLPDIAMVIAVACIIIGAAGFLWNFSLGVMSRWQTKYRHPEGVIDHGSASAGEDRKLYERAIGLVRENRIVDGAKILEELGLNREAAAVLERGEMIHEAAAVFLRRKRYHRAAEVYARHRMWEQAGNAYLLAAGAMQERSSRARQAGSSSESPGVNRVDSTADAS